MHRFLVVSVLACDMEFVALQIYSPNRVHSLILPSCIDLKTKEISKLVLSSTPIVYVRCSFTLNSGLVKVLCVVLCLALKTTTAHKRGLLRTFCAFICDLG